MKKKSNFWDRIMPRDIIAMVMLIGAFYLKMSGIDGEVSFIIAALVGYYLSKRVYEEKNQ